MSRVNTVQEDVHTIGPMHGGSIDNAPPATTISPLSLVKFATGLGIEVQDVLVVDIVVVEVEIGGKR